MNLETELKTLLNRYSKDNASNTPDWLLAEYMIRTLAVYEETVGKRDHWNGTSRQDHIIQPIMKERP